MCGAVLSKRLRELVEKEIDLKFEKVFYLVDSEIVKAMIGRTSYGFNTFAANRIGEIHQGSVKEEWFWVSGKLNIADLTTRGANAEEVSEFSEWQNGPDFLKAEIKEWPIHAEVDVSNIPELKAVSNMMGANQMKERLAD